MAKDIKLHFEPDLPHQREAIEAVCDLFEGGKTGENAFSVSLSLPQRPGEQDLGLTMIGSRNQEIINSPQMLKNLQRIQERNGIPVDTKLEPNDRNFTIEMETGTGKTYVYLRTIYELHKRYGFKKFVIVVPSIAIKEGVFKSMEIMHRHFRTLYDGVEMQKFLFDTDNKGRIGDVVNYGYSNKLYVMVCTVQSIIDIGQEGSKANKAGSAYTAKGNSNKRVLYKEHESIGDRRPIDIIQECKPIVIIDEPQNVGEKGEKGIRELHPLCTLRYSATHKNQYHKIYSLNAVDASMKKLVKGIEVASVQVERSVLSPYIRLIDTSSKRGGSATLELLCKTAGGGYSTTKVNVCIGAILALQTNCIGIYDNIVVQEIHNEYVRLSHLEDPLYKGQSVGGIDEQVLARAMIRATIREHMRKELDLRPRGIKVLSLFFIDKVEDYRYYQDKQAIPGYLVKIFEEEYEKLIQNSKYRSLFEQNPPSAGEVHGGYFSIDKENKWAVPENKKEREAAAAKAYELIMRDKERLLNLDEPLKFIFSHSALREGWDNPNVFQICVLREMNSTIKRRQTIGRGLRICVNQEGKRERADGVNILTVIANEDFKTYAAKLQEEYEEDGVKFGVITKERLGIITYTKDGENVILGQEMAAKIIEDLRTKELITPDGKPTEELKKQLEKGTFAVPEGCEAARFEINQRLIQLTKTLDIKDAQQRETVKSRYDKMCLDQDFVELWNRIKSKTTYRVQFDTDTLVKNVVEKLDKELADIQVPLIITKTAAVSVEDAGVIVNVDSNRIPDYAAMSMENEVVGDILTSLEDATHLTRRTLSRILTGTKYLKTIRYNAPLFEKKVIRVIRRELQELMVQGVTYHPVTIGEREYNAQELFADTEGYLDNMIKSESGKCIMDYVVFDSAVERQFADAAEKSEQVKMYVKLPRDFRIPTPLGAYNPDWALVIEIDGKNHLYFVVETKSVDILDDLPDEDQRSKIHCARRHFNLIGQNRDNPVKYLAPKSSLESVFRDAFSRE